ncbi:hypothetical protein ACHAXA_000157 [Cyclostephanos tholiformis]|uniref:Protein arginine methyltransferase NDUFAF7 n=1 Tax=Cyclostephanos tholiformis TaxID=382380 RepID=A0ABD3SC62_9STRA
MMMNHGKVLLRRYLRKRLSEYYSQPADKVIGSIDATLIPRASSVVDRPGVTTATTLLPPSPGAQHGGAIKLRSIDFSSLVNEWHWKRTYKRLYKEQGGMWLTPVELFRPYYSNVMANFVTASVSTLLDDDTTRSGEGGGVFDVVELGGGRGTNAVAFLDHMSETHPEAYERLRCYKIFDTSPTLHALQGEVLRYYGTNHRGKVEFVHVDMLDVAEGSSAFLSPSDTPTAVIAFELLDNLPHDKIGRCMVTGDILQAELIPVVPMYDIDTSEDGGEVGDHGAATMDTSIRYVEAFARMNDPLLTKILSIDPSLYGPTVGPRWVPTVALGTLMSLLECRPNSIVAWADFDWLPPPDSGGPSRDDAQRRGGGGTSEFDDAHSSAEVAVGDVYGPDEVNKTRGWSGYSPLVDDFGNCSVLTITPI